MYRFILGGVNVECDSPAELFAAIGRPKTQTQPATASMRARKKTKPANAGATMSWRAAELYASRSGGKLSTNQARSFLASHADVKAKLMAELAAK